jgi:hypothetical protein
MFSLIEEKGEHGSSHEKNPNTRGYFNPFLIHITMVYYKMCEYKRTYHKNG